MSKLIAASCAVAACASGIASADDVLLTRGMELLGNPNAPVLYVDWCLLRENEREPKVSLGCGATTAPKGSAAPASMDSATFVTAKVRNFNFVNFDLKLSQAEMKDPAADVVLTALRALPAAPLIAPPRTVFLSFPTDGASAPSNAAFEDAYKALKTDIDAANTLIVSVKGAAKEDFVTDAERKVLLSFKGADNVSTPSCTTSGKNDLATLSCRVTSRAEELLLSLSKEPTFIDSNLAINEDAQVKAAKTIEALADFSKRVGRTLNGKSFDVGTHPGGNKVTVAFTPVRAPASADSISTDAPKSFFYFVERDSSVVLHLGYSVSLLNDDRYQPAGVGQGGGYDRIRDDDTLERFGAFISYPIARKVGVTMGTDIRDAGKRLYVGASYLPDIHLGDTFSLTKRLILSAGVVTGLVEKGVSPITVGGQPFFDSLREKREYQPFVTLGLRVF